MYFKMLGLFSVVLAFVLSSCAPKQSDIVLSEFGNHKIKMKEFENALVKNSGGVEAAKKDSLSQLKDFLDLYTTFKMKIRDAEVRGYDQDSSLVNELNDYKKKIAVSFLLNKEIVDPGIKDLYNKRKYELRVSHIMIRPDTSGDAAALKLATSILDSIKNGASFGEMAKKYSEDVYSKPLGGDIYYITGGMVPESFEDAAYATEPGHVYPHVVKTKFGYHIIKVTERRERIPEIRASHILIPYKGPDGKEDTAAARAKIDSVLTKIKNGADFSEMAKEYSQDPGSKEKGGDLGFFKRRQMVKEFDEAAFDLKVGEVSGVVKTRFGYHLIKVTDQKKYPSFDADKEELKKLFQQTRYQDKYDSLVAKLKTKYNFKVIGKTLDFIASKSDSASVGNDSALVANTKGMTIYTFDDNSKDAGTFLSGLENNHEFAGKLINLSLLKSAIDNVGDEELLEKEAIALESKDSAFAALIKDYKYGIYIFKLQTDEVWNKINIDSTSLHQYYEETKDNYKLPAQVSYSYLTFFSSDPADSAYKKLENGGSFNSIGKISELKLQDVSSSELAKAAFELENPGDFSKPVEEKGKYYIVKLTEKQPERLKTFSEAKAQVSSDLQDKEANKLENNYVQQLKDLYKPVYHYDELTEVFKNK
ncbi:MAG: peptidylprolyl isomerase [Ignavibacteriaceae bacterium]